MAATMRSDIDLFATGEAMGLLVADAAASLGHATSFTRSVAGSESNVAVGMSRLGHAVAFAGRVGADAAGEWVRRTLSAEGIDISCLAIDPDASTGILLRDAPGPPRPPQVEYRRSGSASHDLRMDPETEHLIRRSRVVFLSGITTMLSPTAAAYVMDVVDAAREAGASIVLDPNVRLRLAPADEWRAAMSDLVTRCDILMLGDDEAELLGLPREAARLVRGSTHTVVLKHGSRGATMLGAGEEISAPARPTSVVDVVGAGDAFAAGWISGWLRDLPPAQIMTEAAWVASCVVAARTDIAGLPSVEERDVALYGAADVRR